MESRLTVRPIDPSELDAWLALPGTPDDAVERRIRDAWADRSCGPERTFVAELDGVPIARVAYPASQLASSLPDVDEASVTGLWVRPDLVDPADTGAALLRQSIARLRPPIGFVDAYANPARMDDWAERRRIFEAAGWPLFQEKQGFRWERDGPPAAPLPQLRRLTFRTIDEVGDEAYASLMARAATVGTLDRQDRHYADLVGLSGWGHEMLGYATGDDRSSWLAAADPAGVPAGFVALGTFEGPVGTIVHIGVLPEQRGRGYVHELFAEVERHARRRGFDAMLSDVDVLNAPMVAAMERAGHRSAATDWHVWHHRVELPHR